MTATFLLDASMNSQKPVLQKFGTGLKRIWQNIVARDRPGLYVAIVITLVVAGSAHAIRTNGIFACQTLSQKTDWYAAYCQASEYGDYDHGAFWFNLERDAVKAASNASVLFIGNSRMQFGLSSDELDKWFSSRSIRYFLLGFSHMENHIFVDPLLKKLAPTADVYIINIDLFFEMRSNKPAIAVMSDPESLNRYKQKRRWQKIHAFLCGAASFLCRNEVAFFRSRSTGAWQRIGGDFGSQPVSVDLSVDQDTLAQYTERGTRFLSNISQNRNCIFLTNTPHSDTSDGTAKALADKLKLTLIAPSVSGLTTFDGSHLDRESASRWSAAFIQSLAPHLQNCLKGTRK